MIWVSGLGCRVLLALPGVGLWGPPAAAGGLCWGVLLSLARLELMALTLYALYIFPALAGAKGHTL